jgi:hypothetical protein
MSKYETTRDDNFVAMLDGAYAELDRARAELAQLKRLQEYAVRNKLRFSSSRGELTAEQLWDVPLRSKDGLDLNAVAQTANKALKAA